MAEYRAFAAPLGFTDIQPVPLSALTGDNVTRASPHTPWHGGPTLLDRLEAAPVAPDTAGRPFRFPVQWVVRPDGNFRGLAGTVAAGAIQPGAPVRILPSGRDSTIARIVTQGGERDRAVAGQAVTLALTDDVDVARGDLLVPPGAEPEVTDQFTAHLIWMHDAPLLPGRAYLIRMGTATATAQVTQIKHRADVNSLDHLAASSLGLNDVGLCNLSLDRPLPAEPYANGRACGSFILIDRHSNATLACGMVLHGLRRAGNIQRQPIRIGKPDRATAIGPVSCGSRACRARGNPPSRIWSNKGCMQPAAGP